MKRAFTIFEIVVVIVIVAVLTMLGMPAYQRMIRRGELKEVKVMLDLTKTAAKYYDLRYALGSIVADSTNQDDIWEMLDVDLPAEGECDYEITGAVGGAKMLTVYSYPDGTTRTVLYTYELPVDSSPTINTANPDSRYIKNLQ
ncbi:MAG: prepilin-type N-terminal cleavage/methylation domain-containing protein [Candidatus Omnitrophica bacterium]|nr:prepilin-type N-terminal cleavage/methylation domain-containing protein [Candidatus Omnitrophota bacterium]